MKPFIFLIPFLLIGCSKVIVDNYSEKVIESANKRCVDNGGLSRIDWASAVLVEKQVQYTNIGLTCNNGALFRYQLKEK